jgi:hypothetical protein
MKQLAAMPLCRILPPGSTYYLHLALPEIVGQFQSNSFPVRGPPAVRAAGLLSTESYFGKFIYLVTQLVRR